MLRRRRGVRRLAGVGLLICSGVLMSLATLTPSYGAGGGGDAPCILICGSRGLADFIANVLLFLPFGFALGLLRLGRRNVLILGALVSLGIELTQIGIIPGRDANPSDVISNGLGALLGGMAGRSLPGSLRVAVPSAHRRLSAAALAAISIVVATGVLLSPSLPPTTYHVRWTDGGPSYAAYPGEVLSMSIGGQAVVEGISAFGPSSRAALLRGEPLLVLLSIGDAQAGLSHIATLEHGEADVIFVGAQRDDLVLRYQSNSTHLRLDQPSLRLPSALDGMSVGEPLMVGIWRSRGGYCLIVGSTTECPPFTPASGWTLLQNIDHFSPWLRSRVNILWMLILCLPLGLWARRDGPSGIGLGLAAGAFACLPYLVGLAPLAPIEAAAGAMGFLFGLALQVLATRLDLDA